MNNNKELPFAYSAEDISRINAINLKDPHSVSALNAINISTTENKTNPHDGSTLDSFLLEEAQNKIKLLSEHDKKINMNNDQIKTFVDQTIEIQELKKIINDTLIELPENFIVDHTPENIPEIVRYWIRSYAEEREKRVELETIINDTLRTQRKN